MPTSAAAVPLFPISISGSSLVNGLLRAMIVPNISMVCCSSSRLQFMCSPFAVGRGVGSRYDGSYPGSPGVGSCKGLTGHASSFSKSYKTFLRKFWEAQIVTYEKAEGWIQWTWKAEEADEWTYKAGLENGWIPQVRWTACRTLYP